MIILLYKLLSIKKMIKSYDNCCTNNINAIYVRQDCQKAPIPPAECFSCILPVAVNPPWCGFIFPCHTVENNCIDYYFDDGVRCLDRKGTYTSGWDSKDVDPKYTMESSYYHDNYRRGRKSNDRKCMDRDNYTDSYTKDIRSYVNENTDTSIKPNKVKKIMISVDKSGRIMIGNKFRASVKIHIGIEYEFIFDKNSVGNDQYVILSKTNEGIKELYKGRSGTFGFNINEKTSKEIRELMCQLKNKPSSTIRLVVV